MINRKVEYIVYFKMFVMIKRNYESSLSNESLPFSIDKTFCIYFMVYLWKSVSYFFFERYVHFPKKKECDDYL